MKSYRLNLLLSKSLAFLSVLSIAALFVMLASAAAGAQTTATAGTLRGKVTDPSGAVIAGAAVTATDASGQKTTATTDRQGVYELKGLAPGNYTVDMCSGSQDHETDVAVMPAPGPALRHCAEPLPSSKSKSKWKRRPAACSKPGGKFQRDRD